MVGVASNVDAGEREHAVTVVAHAMGTAVSKRRWGGLGAKMTSTFGGV
jgi:hypothetical protein